MNENNNIAPTGTEAGFDLDKLEALLNATTPGPWVRNFGNWNVVAPNESNGGLDRYHVCTTEGRDYEQMSRNADFIVAAKTHMAAMIALARRAAPATSDMPDTTASASGDDPLLSLIWRINDTVLKALPNHPDAGVRQARNTKSPAEVLVNVESLTRYYREAARRAAQPVQAGEAVDLPAKGELLTEDQRDKIEAALRKAWPAAFKDAPSKAMGQLIWATEQACFASAARASLAPVSAQPIAGMHWCPSAGQWSLTIYADVPKIAGETYKLYAAPVSAQQGAAKAATTVEKDGCRLCLGAKGGVPGNENVIGGVVVCDYCSSTLMDMKSAGWFGADKAPAEGSPQDNCTDCGGSRAHKGDKARDCESCDGTGRGWAQRENVVRAPASGYVHLAGEDVLGGAKRIAENVRHWAPAAQGCPSCGRAPGERRDECEQCPEAPAAQAVDLSKLPLHFKEGIENGGYYLATDVIRALALAASPASTPEAAPEQQLATAEALADEELDAIFMPLMPSLPAPYALRIYGREVEAEVARRFRAQGGNTNDSSANLAAPTAGAATTSEDARDANSNLIAKMREMLDIQGQSGTWNCNPYMHGMYNGMAYMLAMVDGTEPCFRRAPVKWLDKPAEMSTAAKDVLNERSRQVKSEGWSLSHDDAHEGGELALAAACYAAHHIYPNILNIWSWSPEWWKPAEPRRNLVKAGALILADIERIDRAAMRATQQEGE
jgi:hypothetical protein